MQRIFQTILNLADPADPHALDPGNFFTDAENVISMNAPGLDRRELVNGRIEDGPVFPVLHHLLRGQRGKGSIDPGVSRAVSCVRPPGLSD